MAITYDAVACQVWMDPLSVAPGGAQPLCADHASRLSPPRGWVVLDRRDSQASLMTISPPVVEQAGRRGVARRRFPRRWGQFDEPRLEFVGPDVVDLEPDDVGEASALVVESGEVAAPVLEPVTAPEADLEVEASVDVEVPVEPEAVEPEPEPEPEAVEPEPEPEPEAVEPEAVEPEVAAEPEAPVEPSATPIKSPAPADLSAMLKPKGRLLGRAFDVTGDQHSVLTGASGVVDAAPEALPEVAEQP